MKRSLFKSLCLCIFVTFLFPFFAIAQTFENEGEIEAAINQMLLEHPYKVGIFRIGPRLGIFSGYDSNALSSSIAIAEIGDYYTSASPGASVGLKLGRRGYFDFDEDVTFLYYRDLSQLRDIFSTSAATLVYGSSKLLFAAHGSYEDKKARISYEFDIPAQQKLGTVGARVLYDIRIRTGLRFGFEEDHSRFSKIPDVIYIYALPSDYRDTTYSAGVVERIGRGTSITVDGFTGNTRFLNQVNTGPGISDETHFWKILGGFEFDRPKLNGEVKAGFGHHTQVVESRSDLNDLLISTNLNWLFHRTKTAGVFFSRTQDVSAFVQDGFRVTTEGGVRGSVPISERFFADGIITIGKNNYNGQFFFGPFPVTRDNYILPDAGLDFLLTKTLILRGGLGYEHRDSNDPLLNKSRFVFDFGIRLEVARSKPTVLAPGPSYP